MREMRELKRPFLWAGSAVWTLICGYFEVGGSQWWTANTCPEAAVTCGRIPPGYAIGFLGTFIVGYLGLWVVGLLREDLRELEDEGGAV